MMRSAAKLSYEQAQRAVDGQPDETTAPLLQSVLEPLYAAHHVVKIERSQRNPLDLDLPERKLILDADGKLVGVRWPERLEAHKLIEEFMILANVAAAETLEAAHSPLIYRAHDAPSAEKVGRTQRVPLDPRRQARQGRAHAPGAFQQHPFARERRARGGADQRGGAARAGASRIHPRELRSFRPQSAPLRAFHLSDPPLRRPDRASRADPGDESRAGRSRRDRRARTRRRRRAHFRRRTARDGGRTRNHGSADRRAHGRARSARAFPRASPASPASACSCA